ncbi:MAG: PKD domain-containing protein, partial [Planctomycetes bacterium]|nr:PKD domain-containing protein [Planctomycetota bacterium]
SRPSDVFTHQAAPPAIQLKVSVKLPGIGGGDEVLLDASASSASVGRITAFAWTFGDGSKGEGRAVRHAYPRGGRYAVTLMAETDRGERAFQEIPVFVHDPRLQKAPADSLVLVEAEALAAEGGGTSQRIAGRVNASGDVVSYWEKDLGHWLEWSVPIRKAGTYTVMLKYSSGSKEAVRELLIDGAHPSSACKRLVFPGTGGFSAESDNWAYLPVPCPAPQTGATVQDNAVAPLRVPLTPGPHKLRMTNLGGGMALDFILFLHAAQ